MNMRFFKNMFKEKKLYSANDPINGSAEFNELFDYINEKSNSLDLGMNRDGSEVGKGIRKHDIAHYAITRWLNTKLNILWSDPKIFPILYAAFSSNKEDSKNKYNDYARTLTTIFQTYQTWTNQCERYLAYYENQPVKEMPKIPKATLPQQIFILHELAKSNKNKRQPVHSAALIHYEELTANTFDLGDAGTGITRLDVIKYSIAKWLFNKLHHASSPMEWSDKNLSLVLLAAAEVNKQMRSEKNYFENSIVVLDKIINLNIDCEKKCERSLNKFKKMNEKDISNSVSDIITSSKFFNSKLSASIIKLLKTMRKVEARTDEVELKTYRHA